MSTSLKRTKRLWSVIAIFAVSLCVVVLSLFVSPGRTHQIPETTETEKDYTGVFVSKLPLDEQLKVARCVELSAVVNWGEGGPGQSIEVAEAFLMGYPYSGYLAYLEEKYGKYRPVSPGERERNAVAFLTQHKVDEPRALGLYRREIWFYTASGTFQINILLDEQGAVRESSVSFLGKEDPFFRRVDW
jgi:hypothetical protein